jgi:hypothetical protein
LRLRARLRLLPPAARCDAMAPMRVHQVKTDRPDWPAKRTTDGVVR